MSDFSKSKTPAYGSQEVSKPVPPFLLKNITPTLFSETAKECAEVIAANGGRDRNKSTQIRRFYDEVSLWQEKVGNDEARFAENLPFIKMIVAKVAYANGRKLVDNSFLNFMEAGLKQVDSLKSFCTFKTFMEAFMGFYKQIKG